MAIDAFIDRIEPNGLVVVTNNGEAIPLGTMFTKLIKRRAVQNQTDWEFVDLGTIGSVQLVLEAAYRSQAAFLADEELDCVPRGWSAALRLNGEGMAAIGQAIENKAKGDYVHLQI